MSKRKKRNRNKKRPVPQKQPEKFYPLALVLAALVNCGYTDPKRKAEGGGDV